MRKRLLIATFLLLGLLVALAAAAFALYQASQHVPEFYQQALQTDRNLEQAASDQMLQRATALASDTQKEGQWHAVFTAEQINGWLAVDMLRNYPDLLPRSLSNPRVAVGSEQLEIACRYTRGKWTSVLSLAVDAYLAEPNVVALRIRGARAGNLPLPLDTVLRRISEEANRRNFHVSWSQAEGDPVVEITLAPPRDAEDKDVRIETLRLGEGEIRLAGSTEQR